MSQTIQKPQQRSGKSVVGKEVIVGILCLGLGGYNLANHFGYISLNFQAPQLAGNILLTLAGIFLLIQAYKLFKHDYVKSIFLH
jgi:hypothetical protein